MDFKTRAVNEYDKESCLWVEEGATPGLKYLDDTWELFTKLSDGELTGAFLDGKLAGIGKLTRLYGTYGWLEALRVHPDYQGMGAGKAIYDRYLEQMKQMQLSAIGMYTGLRNERSKGLAQRYGLQVSGQFSEFAKKVENIQNSSAVMCKIGADEGEYIVSSHYCDMGNFISINRTFYPVKKGLGALLAANGWVYGDENNLMIAGARFQKEKALHIPYAYGDVNKIMAFANSLAVQEGSKTLSAIRPFDNKEQCHILHHNGFEKSEHDLITLWRGL